MSVIRPGRQAGRSTVFSHFSGPLSGNCSVSCSPSPGPSLRAGPRLSLFESCSYFFFQHPLYLLPARCLKRSPNIAVKNVFVSGGLPAALRSLRSPGAPWNAQPLSPLSTTSAGHFPWHCPEGAMGKPGILVEGTGRQRKSVFTALRSFPPCRGCVLKRA